VVLRMWAARRAISPAGRTDSIPVPAYSIGSECTDSAGRADLAAWGGWGLMIRPVFSALTATARPLLCI